MTITTSESTKKGDVYFLSHGGPPTVEQYHSPPYKAWKKFGKLLNDNPPKGIIVVSAHWQRESRIPSGDVLINNDPSNPLIYDFYNFPQKFYQLQFNSRGSPELLSDARDALKSGGVGYEEESRGLDHGVWIPFKAAFGDSLRASIPLLQISLPASDDPNHCAKLGIALAPLREKGYAVIATGQTVHNLRDMFSNKPMPYTRPFLDSTIEAVSSSEPLQPTIELLTKNKLYKSAHPTDEHFLPLVVAAAAVQPSHDTVEEIYAGVVDITGKEIDNDDDGRGLGWGMWRWFNKFS